ncbi:hypothetical protein BB558_002581, partial [Smittium angustum]
MEVGILPNGIVPSIAILADKGYVGIDRLCRAVKSLRINESDKNKEENERMSSSRIMVEIFFGRLKKNNPLRVEDKFPTMQLGKKCIDKEL